MIIIGLSLNKNGLWKVKQLTQALMKIVKKHKSMLDSGKALVRARLRGSISPS